MMFGRNKGASTVQAVSPQRARLEAIIAAEIEPAAMARARLISGRTRQPFELTLNQLGVLSDAALLAAYQKACGLHEWDAASDPPSLDSTDLDVSTEFLRLHRLLPIRISDREVTCVICDPFDAEGIDGLKFATGREVSCVLASQNVWRLNFDERFGTPSSEETPDERRLERDVQLVSDLSVDSESTRLLASMVEIAVARGASDIHFEPRRHDFSIRLRLDGRLQDFQNVRLDLATPFVSRIKVLANMDLGERRLPQDGRVSFVVAGRSIEARVSIIPSMHGEAAVLRLLDRSGIDFTLGSLGFSEKEAIVLRQAMAAPHGMFLVSGPTGSGKTTTLYALLNLLAGSDRKILSIEDPVEYHFSHVVQSQVAPAIGLTFASALRAFLRQDPDVILVGEIRDAETAAVAVQAAMTGHLVMASVHANDAVKVIPRLLDMGIEAYQLAAAFRGAAAQRLVRRLCPHCITARDMTAAEVRFVSALQPHESLGRTFASVGCEACNGQGYKGRVAIGEAFLCGDSTLDLIAQSQPLGEIQARLVGDGFQNMIVDGYHKSIQGMIALADVMAQTLQ